MTDWLKTKNFNISLNLLEVIHYDRKKICIDRIALHSNILTGNAIHYE